MIRIIQGNKCYTPSIQLAKHKWQIFCTIFFFKFNMYYLKGVACTPWQQLFLLQTSLSYLFIIHVHCYSKGQSTKWKHYCYKLTMHSWCTWQLTDTCFPSELITTAETVQYYKLDLAWLDSAASYLIHTTNVLQKLGAYMKTVHIPVHKRSSWHICFHTLVSYSMA